jgi:hypothetical protein
MNARTIELYSDDFGETKDGKKGTASRYVRVYIDKEDLTIEEQDIGPLIKQIYDDSDHERIFTVSKLAVKKALSVDSDEELFSILKERFNEMDAFDKFSKLTTLNNIEYISCYAG